MHVCSAVSDSLWPMDCSPPGSSVHGILQARILEWVDISYSKGIFLTQRSNLCLLCLLHWQADSLYLWNPGSPKALVRERERECVCVCVCVCVFSHARLFVTHGQVPLSMDISRQEYWSGLPFPSPENLPDPRVKLISLASPALAGRFLTTSATSEGQH